MVISSYRNPLFGVIEKKNLKTHAIHFLCVKISLQLSPPVFHLIHLLLVLLLLLLLPPDDAASVYWALALLMASTKNIRAEMFAFNENVFVL